MPNIGINTSVEPSVLRAYSKNEATLSMRFENGYDDKILWCECEIHVEKPLSLAHDRELLLGKTRIGIIKPRGSISKQVKLFTQPNNYPSDYNYSIILYAYDEDGAIAERQEYKSMVKCEENAKNIQDKQGQ
ncbi:MAG: hypothetical protein ACP5RM_00265 [Candidatus Micrarchaeia archaeon]